MERVIYQQMGRTFARVIKDNGGLTAEIRVGGRWRRATTREAALIMRNALEYTLMEIGDKVVALDGNRLVLGTVVGGIGEQLEVCVTRDCHLHTDQVLPYAVARRCGVWPFKPGAQVVAKVGGEWKRCRWLRYEDGKHTVRLLGGDVETCDRAYIAAEAIELGLIDG